MNETGDEHWTSLGGLVDSSRVTFCVYSDTLDPEELTRDLGIAPTHAHRAGDTRESERAPGLYNSGAWILDLGDIEKRDPEDAIWDLLNWLPSDPEFWKHLMTSYDVKVGLSLVMKDWNRGFTLSPELQHRLGTLGLRLDVELWYMPSPGEIV
jgi:hypothetical protein